MNKTELINELSSRLHIKKSEATKLVNEFIDIVSDALVENKKVRLSGLGIFQVRSRDAYIGKMPGTGRLIHIPETRRIGFRASKSLRSRLNATT